MNKRLRKKIIDIILAITFISVNVFVITKIISLGEF